MTTIMLLCTCGLYLITDVHGPKVFPYIGKPFCQKSKYDNSCDEYLMFVLTINFCCVLPFIHLHFMMAYIYKTIYITKSGPN